MEIEKIQAYLDKTITIIALRGHSKASEHYVDVIIDAEDDFTWTGSIPYYYRRTGLFIEAEKELAEYLTKIKKHFTKTEIKKFQTEEKARWEKEMSGKTTTKPFFDVLLNMGWQSIGKDFPNNPNWARRIQDIKEFGYTLATHTNMSIKGTSSKGTHISLLPIPKGGVTGYEVMSPAFKSKAIKALGAVNAYEDRVVNVHGLLPDHKFPEIRWDSSTSESNEELTVEEIKIKFQLLDNQRNQQKREVCRKCFQTDTRGTVFGINYFYEGDKNWPTGIPKVGKDAEKGCVGCGWYDLPKWRESLNKYVIDMKKGDSGEIR